LFPGKERVRVLRALNWITFAYCAAVVNFSWVQSWHNSDTVIPALISIDRYTPFYWAENRFGMLVPLLASPVSDYGWNLLIQSFLVVLSGATSLILLHALDIPKFTSSRILLGAILLLILFKPAAAVTLLLPGSPYLVALFLLLAALYLLFERGGRPPLRWCAGTVLVLLSLWVNVSNVVTAVVAVALWPSTKATVRGKLGVLGIILGSAAVVLMFSSRFPGTDYQKLLPVIQWAGNLWRIASSLSNFIHPLAAAALVVSAGILQALRRRGRRYSPLHALVVGAACQIAATSGLEWVALNNFDSRYIAGCVFLIIGAAALTLAAPAMIGLERFAGAPASHLVGCCSCILLFTLVFGLPSPARARANMERATSDLSGPVDRLGCTHFVGNYWYVWETVFHDRLQTGQRRLWGISHRAAVTRDSWTKLPREQRRYCALCSDTMIEHMRTTEGVGPLTKETELSGVCLFKELAQ
jgi:hypothetical protein